MNREGGRQADRQVIVFGSTPQCLCVVIKAGCSERAQSRPEMKGKNIILCRKSLCLI